MTSTHSVKIRAIQLKTVSNSLSRLFCILKNRFLDTDNAFLRIIDYGLEKSNYSTR